MIDEKEGKMDIMMIMDDGFYPLGNKIRIVIPGRVMEGLIRSFRRKISTPIKTTNESTRADHRGGRVVYIIMGDGRVITSDIS